MTRWFAVAAIGVLLCVTGCVRYNVLEYAPMDWDLDGKNELHVSTYPSWFPKEVSSVPFLYKELRTPDAVYFQVFVRDIKAKAGRNPNLQSIRIHSFSYAQEGQPPIELIADYDSNFWMQDQPQHNTTVMPPVPCVPGTTIKISVSLNVNGKDYAFDAAMPCVIRTRIGALLAHSLAV